MTESQQPYAGGSIPENYEKYLVPVLFADYGADLASYLVAPAGGSVLETACGTGALTRQLCKVLPEGTQLTVTDLAPAMVDLVQQTLGSTPCVDFAQADAAELPFADSSFDAVICQFSVMLFPDKQKAMREAFRVLKPGGWFIFSVWDRLERNAFSHAVHLEMERLYDVDPPRFLSAPYSYHDVSLIDDDLQATGFSHVVFDRKSRESKAANAHQVAAGLVAGSPLANQISERASLSLGEAVKAVEGAIEKQFGTGAIAAPMQAYLITAKKNAS